MRKKVCVFFKKCMTSFPYGMLLNNRHGAVDSDSYRYGFQGQEHDDEVKGEGNSYNYTYRMHDPRLGRFFAVDPLSPEYPFYTPYQFSGNRVIDKLELEGLEYADYDPQNDPFAGIRIMNTIMQDLEITSYNAVTYWWYGANSGPQSYPLFRSNTRSVKVKVQRAYGFYEVEKMEIPMDGGLAHVQGVLDLTGTALSIYGGSSSISLFSTAAPPSSITQAGKKAAAEVAEQSRYFDELIESSENLLNSVKNKRVKATSQEVAEVGENALKKLGGKSQVRRSTSDGDRIIDQLVDGVAYEAKTGYKTLTDDISRQIAKDKELLDTDKVDQIIWRFYESPVTGKAGASEPLQKALKAAGIKTEVIR